MIFNKVPIIFEDNHILVVNKPDGLLSQKDVTGDDSIIELLKNYIKTKYSKPGNVFLGSVHRIDRPASGVMVFAKTSKALTRLTESIRLKHFTKHYLVILDGEVNSQDGYLTHYLVKNEKANIVKAFNNEMTGGKESNLSFKNLGIVNGRTLLDVNLLTGRSHQIRSQLSKKYFPVTGDFKYGSGFKSRKHKIYLHSYRLKFPHPITKASMEFSFKPDFDDKIWSVFEKYID